MNRVRWDRLPDDAVLTALAVGEPDAAAVFVRRFQRRIYGLAITIVHDPGTAEDVAQRAFERICRHAATYDARRGSVVTWVLTITRNLAIDAVRVRRPVPTSPTLLDELFDGEPLDPAEAAVRSDAMAQARRALGELPVEQRRAIVLATVAGHTMTEIAELEAVPVGTVKTRIRLGMARVRASLQETTT